MSEERVHGLTGTVWVGGYGVAIRVDGPGPFTDSLTASPHCPGMTVLPRTTASAVATFRAAPTSQGWELTRDGAAIHVAPSIPDLADAFWSEVELTVAAHAGPPAFVHAGAVAFAGRALILPGASGAGKSTLVRALLLAGATYLSDEFALLDARGWAHPYARPLRLRGAGGRAEAVDPRALGAAVSTGPLPVGAVVVTRYQPGGSWTPSPLTSGQVALALIGNAVGAKVHREVVLGCTVAAAKDARGLAGDRGAADQVAARIIDWARSWS